MGDGEDRTGPPTTAPLAVVTFAFKAFEAAAFALARAIRSWTVTVAILMLAYAGVAADALAAAGAPTRTHKRGIQSAE